MRKNFFTIFMTTKRKTALRTIKMEYKLIDWSIYIKFSENKITKKIIKGQLINNNCDIYKLKRTLQKKYKISEQQTFAVISECLRSSVLTFKGKFTESAGTVFYHKKEKIECVGNLRNIYLNGEENCFLKEKYVQHYEVLGNFEDFIKNVDFTDLGNLKFNDSFESNSTKISTPLKLIHLATTKKRNVKKLNLSESEIKPIEIKNKKLLTEIIKDETQSQSFEKSKIFVETKNKNINKETKTAEKTKPAEKNKPVEKNKNFYKEKVAENKTIKGNKIIKGNKTIKGNKIIKGNKVAVKNKVIKEKEIVEENKTPEIKKTNTKIKLVPGTRNRKTRKISINQIEEKIEKPLPQKIEKRKISALKNEGKKDLKTKIKKIENKIGKVDKIGKIEKVDKIKKTEKVGKIKKIENLELKNKIDNLELTKETENLELTKEIEKIKIETQFLEKSIPKNAETFTILSPDASFTLNSNYDWEKKDNDNNKTPIINTNENITLPPNEVKKNDFFFEEFSEFFSGDSFGDSIKNQKDEKNFNINKMVDNFLDSKLSENGSKVFDLTNKSVIKTNKSVLKANDIVEKPVEVKKTGKILVKNKKPIKRRKKIRFFK